MGLTTERGSAADGFEAVPVPLASGEATENSGAMLRRRSALPSRRSVLYLHCRPDTFVPEDLVGWYTDGAFTSTWRTCARRRVSARTAARPGASPASTPLPGACGKP